MTLERSSEALLGMFPPKGKAGQCGGTREEPAKCSVGSTLTSLGQPPTPGMHALSFQEYCELSKDCCLSDAKCSLMLSTPWTAVHQAAQSITISLSLFKLMSIESVMPSNHLILCHPLLLCPQSSPFFPMNHLFPSGDQSVGASASASVLPVNIQG